MSSLQGETTGTITVRQEPVMKRILNWIRWFISNREMWRVILFSNLFQLLPVGVMLFIQFVSECKFGTIDVFANIIAFGIIACISNLSEMLEKDTVHEKGILELFMAGILIFILCFSLILYCLMLLYDQKHLNIDLYIIIVITLIFVGCTILVSMWQVARKSEK